VRKPASTQPRVARKPAPPAPMITTSYVWSVSLYAEPTVVITTEEDISAPTFLYDIQTEIEVYLLPFGFQTMDLQCP